MISNQKMRLCLIGQKIHVQSRSSDTGLLWPLARGLSQRGHDVTIISSTSPMNKSEIFRDGIRAYYVLDQNTKNRSLKFADAVHKKFLSLHSEKPFDLVHSLDSGGFKIGRHKNNFKTRIAYDVQSILMSELFSIIAENDGSLKSQIKTYLKLFFNFTKNYFLYDKPLLDTADGFFVTTPQQRLILERYYAYPDFHTYTVPYGINLGDLAPREDSENFKLKMQLPEDSQFILSVSDFSNTFEIIPLLKAFERSILKVPNLYLILVGDGPKFKEVEYLMLKHVLGSRVIMTGAMSAEKLLEYISATSIYVDLSSRSTGLEPSLIEAMAQKKVVIGSELSPISEIIEDGIDGYLIRPADDVALDQHLEKVFSSPELLTTLGEKAREKILHFFNREKMIESLLSAYQQIVEKRKI